jgi:hypothetical protein
VRVKKGVINAASQGNVKVWKAEKGRCQAEESSELSGFETEK